MAKAPNTHRHQQENQEKADTVTSGLPRFTDGSSFHIKWVQMERDDIQYKGDLHKILFTHQFNVL